MNAKTFYALDADARTLYTSNDGGSHFTLLTSEVPPGKFKQIRAVPEKAGQLWLANESGLYQFDAGEKEFTGHRWCGCSPPRGERTARWRAFPWAAAKR